VLLLVEYGLTVFMEGTYLNSLKSRVYFKLISLPREKSSFEGILRLTVQGYQDHHSLRETAYSWHKLGVIPPFLFFLYDQKS